MGYAIRAAVFSRVLRTMTGVFTVVFYMLSMLIIGRGSFGFPGGVRHMGKRFSRYVWHRDWGAMSYVIVVVAGSIKIVV